MSAPAAAITRSCRSRCPSRRRPGRASWCGPACMPSEPAALSAAALIELCRLYDASGVHVTFATEPEYPLARRTRFLQRTDQQFHWENAGYAQFRRFSRRAHFAQAQDHPARAPRRAGERHQHPLAHRQRPHRRRVGRVLRLLHGDRLAQMGPALPHPLVLFAGRRDHARAHPAGDGQAQRALDRRRHQFHRLAIRCSAATGAPSSIIRSCISRSAIIRRSITPSRTSSPASRPARRASTRSRAAICRKPPIRRITSPTRPAPRDRGLSRSASAPMSRPRRELAEAGPFRKDLADEPDPEIESLRGEHHADLRPQQRLRQDPARRVAVLQGLRGRPRARLSRHHAARAGPYAGDPKAPARNILDITPDDLAHLCAPPTRSRAPR